jgi:muconate cycloisomerase
MRIRKLTAWHVCLPLKRPFSHASHVRQASENVLIECELHNGTRGWGEGVPREYVTGETPHTCFDQLAETCLQEQLAGDFDSWDDVIATCERFQPAQTGDNPRGCGSNALKCAVELSILDAFAREVGEPVSQLLDHFPTARSLGTKKNEVRYSTVIGSGRRLRNKALKMRLYGFRHCKVKVGAGDDDVSRLRTIRRWIGPGVDLRIDANEAWFPDELPGRLEPLAQFQIRSVEQPCPHAKLAELASKKSQLAVPIMLDESVTSLADGERAIELGACDSFNIRLSKCGGYLASLRLAALAQRAGLGYQLGCHPGESGILSAAGRHWASSVSGIQYVEGSYDRHLFRRLLTHEDLTFGYGGRAPALTGPGLGVTVNPQVLRDVTIRTQTFSLS